VHLTKFYRLDHLCAKNYQIWWRSDKVLTKTSWIIFWPTLYCLLSHVSVFPRLRFVYNRRIGHYQLC